MSPRHNRRQPDPVRADDEGAPRATEHVEGDWRVRSLPGNAEAKTYRCPGCDQEILSARPHIVAWPLDGDPADRRHWHTACWRSRGHRAPNVQRGRSAPRY